MSRSVGKGAMVLVISGVVCKLFGAFFRLPLTNVLGIEGIAIFQMVMSLYSLAVVFVSNGITSSLAKLVASARARGEVLKTGAYLKIAVKYVLILGLSLGFVLAIFSRQLAMVQGFKSGSSYLLMPLLLTCGGLIGAYRGVIQGHENMTPTAISQIIEQVSRFAFGLSFAHVFVKYGVGNGVLGAFLGISISEVLALLYLQIILNKKVRARGDNKLVKKEFYSAVLPLSFSNAIIPLTHAIESLTILPLLALAGIEKEVAQKLYGLQTGMIGTILGFPLLVSLAVGMALLPKVSYLSSCGSKEEEKSTISNAFSIMWAFLVPLVLGVSAISQEFYLLVYPNVINGYLSLAKNLTIVTAISILMAGIMQFLFSILQAKGLFGHALCFSVVGGLVKLAVLAIFARIPTIGIYAIPISNALLNATISICAMIKLYQYVKIEAFKLFLPLASGFVMFLSVELLVSAFGGLLGIILSVFAGGGVYLVLTLPLWIDYLKSIVQRFKKDKKRLEN